MTTHTESTMLDALDTPGWLTLILRDRFPDRKITSQYVSWKLYRQVTIRLPTDQLTRLGKPKPQRRRFDGVVFVRPNKKIWQPITIGIEVKCSARDLSADGKLADYLGYTDYMILAVPARTGDFARGKVAIPELIDYGVVEVGDDNFKTIDPLPDDLKPTAQHSAELYAELLMHNLRNS